ncbi:MAG: nucleotidyltransferase domain-containing protein [Archangium sp.]|nr:nucleotidyltransferase domain-containing protein [Archangium sp.]MDP3154912.1 nucleotidyltransferase domain-containing protein [Archangium sp.]MDP3576031.1 nucleotidyltransferase domain-containing protein [Archangium sp.]
MTTAIAASPSVPEDFLKRIVDELHPLEIWLFGSRARGTARPESDWDLLAVLPDTASSEDLDLVPLWGRLRDLHAKRVELFPITKSDFDRCRRSLGTLAQIVASEGVVVYAR